MSESMHSSVHDGLIERRRRLESALATTPDDGQLTGAASKVDDNPGVGIGDRRH